MRPQIYFTSSQGESLHLDDVFYWQALRNVLLQVVTDWKRNNDIRIQFLDLGYEIEDENHYRFKELVTVRSIAKQFRNSQGTHYLRLRDRLDMRISEARSTHTMEARSQLDPFISSLANLRSERDMYETWELATLDMLDRVEAVLENTINPSLPATLEDYDRYIGTNFQPTNPLMQVLIQQARIDG